MEKISFASCLFGLMLAFAVSPASAAQQPAPAKGQEVIVTQSASGEELRGRLLELTPESLAIMVDGRRVDVPIDRVLRIDSTHDSVKNGAIIGAAVMGGWCALVCGQGLDSSSDVATVALINTGLGALIGAGIDALHKGRSPIYVKPAASGAALQVRLRF
jgi:hypothetical protein